MMQIEEKVNKELTIKKIKIKIVHKHNNTNKQQRLQNERAATLWQTNDLAR